LILFTSSCQWSDRCFFDVRGDWFSPRFSSGIISSSSSVQNISSPATPMTNNYSSIDFNNNINYNNDSFATFIKETINSTATALAGAAIEEAKRRVSSVLANGTAADYIVRQQQQQGGEWTGIGLEWVRSLLGRREWTIPCIDVKVRL
jgi:hypothetical protein